MFNIWKVAGNEVKDKSIPNLLECLCIWRDSHIKSEFRALFVLFIFPFRSNAGFENLDCCHLIILSFKILEYFEFFVCNIIQNIIYFGMRYFVPSSMKLNDIIEPCNFPHFSIPLYCFIDFWIKIINILPYSPFEPFIKFQFIF